MTIGRINYTELSARGYDKNLAAGALAGAGTLGILIPPSIVPIMFVAVVGGSVGELFLAGIVPGILVAALFSSWIIIRAILHSGNRAARHRALYMERSMARPVTHVANFGIGVLYSRIAL